MSEQSRLIKNTGLIAIGNFGAKVVSFLLLPLYTSILTTAEYGTYDYIVAASTFLIPVVTMCMYEALFRFIIDTGNKGEEFIKVTTNALLVVMMNMVLLGGILVALEICSNLSNLIYIWLYVAANSLYCFSNNLLRGQGKIKEYAVISSGKNILTVILNVIAIVVLHWGMEGLLGSLIVSEVGAFLIVFVFSRLWEQIRFKYINLETIKSMLSYSMPLVPNALSASIINMSDRMIISAYMGTSANGIYSIAYKFPNMIETVYHYFYTAWSESASRVFSRNKEEAVRYYQSLYNTIDNLIFSAVILMIASMPILFRIFIKGDYIQGFSYVPLLLFAMYFDSLAKFYSGLYAALKKTKAIATSTVVAAIVNIAINIICIRSLGLYAAAGSTLIADIVLVLVRKYFIKKDIPFKKSPQDILLKAVVVIIVIVLYDYQSWFKISACILLAVLYATIVNCNILKNGYIVLKKKIESLIKGLIRF